MELFEAIGARRAVRSFSQKPVDPESIERLVHAAIRAPTALNAQPWGFAVVQDRARLRRYSDRAKAVLLEGLAGDAKAAAYADLLKSETYNIFYDAGTLVTICARVPGPYVEADCWLAAENLMLAACALGLGSCPVGFALMVLNAPDVKVDLGIPPEGSAVAPIIVGYPSGPGEPTPRETPKMLSWLR